MESKKIKCFPSVFARFYNSRIHLAYYKVVNELYEHRGNARLVCMMHLRSSWKPLRGQSEASWTRLGDRESVPRVDLELW